MVYKPCGILMILDWFRHPATYSTIMCGVHGIMWYYYAGPQWYIVHDVYDKILWPRVTNVLSSQQMFRQLQHTLWRFLVTICSITGMMYFQSTCASWFADHSCFTSVEPASSLWNSHGLWTNEANLTLLYSSMQVVAPMGVRNIAAVGSEADAATEIMSNIYKLSSVST